MTKSKQIKPVLEKGLIETSSDEENSSDEIISQKKHTSCFDALLSNDEDSIDTSQDTESSKSDSEVQEESEDEQKSQASFTKKLLKATTKNEKSINTQSVTVKKTTAAESIAYQSNSNVPTTDNTDKKTNAELIQKQIEKPKAQSKKKTYEEDIDLILEMLPEAKGKFKPQAAKKTAEQQSFEQPKAEKTLLKPQDDKKTDIPQEFVQTTAENNSLENQPKLSKVQQKRLKKKKKAALGSTEDAVAVTPPQAPPVSAPPAKGVSIAARLAQQRLHLLKQEEERQKEAERILIEKKERERIEEEARQKLEAEKKEHQRQLKQERKQRLKKEGKLLTAAQKERLRKTQILREQFEKTLILDSTQHKKPLAERKKKRRKHLQDIESLETVEKEQQAPSEKDKEEPTSAAAERTTTHDNTLLPIQPNEELQLEQDDASIASSWDKDTESELSENEKVKPKILGRVVSTVDINKTVVTTQPKEPIKNLKSEKKALSPTIQLDQAELRSPICCILGHVDTGKTKLLDRIRRTNVQLEEAGGITQQIGATFFPKESLAEQYKKVDPELEVRAPGLLIIDTPGHESFNNLRVRGSSLCDIAILVVDIMHGFEPQTRESINLLKAKKCPFIVALNKIDRLYDWKAVEWEPAQKALSRQKESTKEEFKSRLQQVLLQLMEHGLNCACWWEVDNVKKTVSVVPTSAHTGEGIPDLLLLLVKLTQSVMTRNLVYEEKVQCTILEVKNIEGLGTTIDVILVSGVLNENDKLIVCGLNGPIVTFIRALLTPQPLKELRVRNDYVHHKQIKAAMGVKIAAPNLEDAVAGTSVIVANNFTEAEIDKLKEEVMVDITTIFKNVDRSGVGVYVMASTLGSLEALLEFLNQSKIPVFAVNIGTVNKLDVKKASVIREKGKPEYCCILAFDVKVDPEASKEAQSLGVKIFKADIIYHLFDQFNKHLADVQQSVRQEKQAEVVFPCLLSIFPDYVFNKKDPIVLGVKIEEGTLRVNTPLCVPEKEKLFIGKVISLEHNKKAIPIAKKGDEVAIKIVGDSSITVGRHFDASHKLCSRLTRDSLDCLREFFGDELTKDDIRLAIKLKKILGIV